jgi:hypothetical protein
MVLAAKCSSTHKVFFPSVPTSFYSYFMRMRRIFSAAVCNASAAVSGMVKVQDKTQCVICFTENKSTATAQSHFRSSCGRDARVCNAVRRCFIQLRGSGSAEKRKLRWRLRTFEKDVECLRLSCQHSPKKSTARWSL